MPTPVLWLELLHASRPRRLFPGPWFLGPWFRLSRQHLLRGLYTAWLAAILIVFAYLWAVRDQYAAWGNTAGSRYRQELGEVAEAFVLFLIGQQYLLLLGLVPALAAASVTDEKTRRTLPDLLTTDLTATEIVLGKLIAQVVRGADLFLVGLPVICFIGALAGVEPVEIAAVGAGTAAPMVGLTAVGILASVCYRSTANAVTLTYAIGAPAFLGLWVLSTWVPAFDPAALMGLRTTAADPSLLFATVVASWSFWGLLTMICVPIAVGQLRPSCIHQLQSGSAAPSLPPLLESRPGVSDSPIRWKEQYVTDLKDWPSWRGMSPIARIVTVVVLAFLASVGLLWCWGAGLGSNALFAAAAYFQQGAAVAVLFSLIVGVRCGTAVSGERERGTWDSLLLTPMEPRQILRSKVWGIMHSVRCYLNAWAITAGCLAALWGPLPVCTVAACWTLAWPLMYYLGACGILASVQSTSSWRGLLQTLFIGYRKLLTTYLFLAFPLGLVTASVLAALFYPLIGATFGFFGQVVLCLPLTLLIAGIWQLGGANELLHQAEEHLAAEDRIPQKALCAGNRETAPGPVGSD